MHGCSHGQSLARRLINFEVVYIRDFWMAPESTGTSLFPRAFPMDQIYHYAIVDSLSWCNYRPTSPLVSDAMVYLIIKIGKFRIFTRPALIITKRISGIFEPCIEESYAWSLTRPTTFANSSIAAGAGWVGYIFIFFIYLPFLMSCVFWRWLNMTEILQFRLLNPNGSCQLLPRTSSLCTG